MRPLQPSSVKGNSMSGVGFYSLAPFLKKCYVSLVLNLHINTENRAKGLFY